MIGPNSENVISKVGIQRQIQVATYDVAE